MRLLHTNYFWLEGVFTAVIFPLMRPFLIDEKHQMLDFTRTAYTRRRSLLREWMDRKWHRVRSSINHLRWYRNRVQIPPWLQHGMHRPENVLGIDMSDSERGRHGLLLTWHESQTTIMTFKNDPLYPYIVVRYSATKPNQSHLDSFHPIISLPTSHPFPLIVQNFLPTYRSYYLSSLHQFPFRAGRPPSSEHLSGNCGMLSQS